MSLLPDSWLQGLGVTGISSSDDDSSGGNSNATDSIASGAKSIKDGYNDIADSYNQAKKDVQAVGDDLQDAKRATRDEIVDRVKSGAYYAVGDDDDAQKARDQAAADADKRDQSFDKAKSDADDAQKQVFGDDSPLKDIHLEAEAAESQSQDDQ